MVVLIMKYLHTMIRVNNLEESIRFYSEVLGMKLLSKNEYPEGKFTLAFLGYGNSKQDPCVELTYNWDKSTYNLGDAFGHLAYGVSDIYKTCETIKKAGGKVVREPGPMKHGSTVIAFIEDPNGYKIELIETK
jgi:lactoylglutathione lyase